MTVGNQLRIQEPTADLLDWCKKNMVLANPDYAKKVRMHLWLGNTPQKLYLMQWDGDTLVLPYGCLNTVLSMGECEVINDLPSRLLRENAKYLKSIHCYRRIYG